MSEHSYPVDQRIAGHPSFTPTPPEEKVSDMEMNQEKIMSPVNKPGVGTN